MRLALKGLIYHKWHKARTHKLGFVDLIFVALGYNHNLKAFLTDVNILTPLKDFDSLAPLPDFDISGRQTTFMLI